MGHTFVLQPGEWSFNGDFTDAGGQRASFEGRTLIRHEHGIWTGDSWSQKTGEPASRFENHYRIQPLAPGALATSWTCVGTAGRSAGQFVLVEDAMFSCGRSEDGLNEIVECLTQLSADRYSGRSLLIRDGKLFLTMSALLIRAGSAEEVGPERRS